MMVDIHTHIRSSVGLQSVYNVPLEHLHAMLLSNVEGFFSAGIHPWKVTPRFAAGVELLEALLADRRLVAVGECGLDKQAQAPLHVQAQVFELQAGLAEEFHKPLIIHCVGCFNELLQLKKRLKPTQLWIVHGFRGKPQLADQLLRAGCALSFGERFNPASVQVTPLDRLYVETDESPLPIADLYVRVAAAKGCAVDELTAGCDLLRKLYD